VVAAAARCQPDLVQGFCRLTTIWLPLANTSVTMPPTRWLSMSASVCSLMRSQQLDGA
jgi:hypothetical protein